MCRQVLEDNQATRDAWLHRRFGKLVGLVFRVVPRRYRRHPRARAGWDRATGRIGADAPLVHTPARNLPPADERDNPMHYCPQV
jgi:uncharacterized protein (DUF2236 family)